MNRLGEQDVTVTYQGKTTTYKMNIREKQVVSIEIKDAPQTVYLQGDTLNLADGSLVVLYDNEKTEKVKLTHQDVSVEGFNKDNVGDQVLTVKFHEKTDNFTVTVKSWDAVNELVDAIDKIPEKLNEDDRATIDSLVSKYNSLSEREKSEIKNYDKLQKAQDEFNKPFHDEVNEDDRATIDSLVSKYNSLSEREKSEIKNYDKLQKAQDEFNKPFHDEVSIDDIQFVADGPAAALPYETKLDVLKAIAKANLDDYDKVGEAYNIGYHYLNKDGEGVNAEPKAPITLAVALKGLSEGRNYKVGIELKDGSIKFVDATYQKGYLIFETDQVGTLSFWQSKAPAAGGQTDVTTQTPSSVLNPGTSINGGGQGMVVLLSIIALLGVTFCVVLLRYRGKNRN